MRSRFLTIKNCILLLMALALALSPMHAHAQSSASKPLVIAITDDYPPFSVLSPTGQVTGLLVEIWRLWSDLNNIPIEFVIADFPTTLELIKDGRADIHSGLFPSNSRAKWMDFSNALHEVQSSLYFTLDQDSNQTLKDLSGKRVGSVIGYYQLQYIKDNFPQIKAKGFPNGQALVLALLNGEIDSLLSENLTVEADLDKFGVKGTLKRASSPTFSNILVAAVAKGRTELIHRINTGFAAIPRSALARLEALWLPNPEDRFYPIEAGLVPFSPSEELWVTQHPQITIGVLSHRPPLDIKIPEGPYTGALPSITYNGLNADILEEIQNKLGITIVPRFFKDEETLIRQMSKQEIDAALGVFSSPLRERNLLFSQPYVYDNAVLVTRQGNPEITNWNDLERKSIFISSTVDLQNVPAGAIGSNRITRTGNAVMSLKSLIRGEGDACIEHKTAVIDAMKTFNLRGLHIVATFRSESRGLRIAINKNQPTLFSLLRKSINAIPYDTLTKIQHRWLPPTLPAPPPPQISLSEDEQKWLDSLSRPLVVGTLIDWPPFEFIKNGTPTGYSHEFFNKVKEKSGLPVRYLTGYTWQELLDRFNKGEIDILPTIAQTPGRLETMAFTEPYHSVTASLVVHEDDSNTTSLDDLKGRKIAVILGSATSNHIATQHPDITQVPVQTELEGLIAVSQKKVDAHVAGFSVITHILRETPIPAVQLVGEVWLGEEGHIRLRIGTAKREAILLDIIQKGMDAISGQEISDLRQRWIGSKAFATSTTPPLILNDTERKWREAAAPVNICVSPAWKPLEWISPETGEHEGLIADYLKLIANISGLKFKLIPTSSKEQSLDILKSGRALLMPALLKEARPQQNIIYSKPYMELSNVVIMRQDSAFITHINDLVGLRIGTQNDPNLLKYIKENAPALVATPYDDTPLALHALSEGKIDAYIGSLEQAGFNINTHEIKNLKLALRLPLVHPLHFGINRVAPEELVSILQKSIDSIPPQAIRNLYTKWISLAPEQKGLHFDFTKLAMAIAIACAILLLIFLRLASAFSRLSRKHKDAVSRLTATNYKLNSLTNITKQALIITDSNSTILFWNLTAESIFGHSAHEVTSSRVSLFTDSTPLTDFFNKSMQSNAEDSSRTPTCFTAEGIRKDGTKFQARITATRIQLNATEAIAAAIEDISQLTRLEKAQQLAQEELQIIFETSSVGILFLYEGRIIHRCNPYLAEMFGYESTEELEGQEFSTLHNSNEHYQAFRDKFEGPLHRGETVSTDWQMKRKNDTIVWCTLTGKKASPQRENTIQHSVIWCIADKSQQMATEELLRKEQAHSRIFLQYTTEGIISIDKSGYIIFANESAYNMLGMTQGDVDANNIHSLIHHSYSDGTPYPIELCPVYKTLTTGSPNSGQDEVFWKPDGTHFPIKYTCAPVLQNDEILGAVLTFHDISEYNQKQQALLAAQKAEEASRRDHRTLLTSLATATKLPIARILDETKHLQSNALQLKDSSLKTLLGAAQMLHARINDILDYTRIETHSLGLHPAPFDLNEFLDDLARALSVTHEQGGTEKHVELLFDIENTLPARLLGDRERLLQILTALGSDALRSTEHGEVIISLQSDEHTKASVTMTFTVKDTSMGLTTEQQSHLFRLLAYSGPPPLGTHMEPEMLAKIAICKPLIEAMGGKLQAESTYRKGSTFSFTVTFSCDDQQNVITPDVPASLKDMPILVVDDNDSSREIFMEILLSLSLAPVGAASGEECLSILEKTPVETPFKLVFMDWNMPDMDGVETARLIAEHPSLQTKPMVIMVTAHSDEKLREEAGGAPHEAILTKPLSPKAVLGALTKALGTDA